LNYVGSTALTQPCGRRLARERPRTCGLGPIARRAEINSAACVNEHAQQFVALAADFPRAAIGEVEDYRGSNQSGFERPDALFKFHHSFPVCFAARPEPQIERNTARMFYGRYWELFAIISGSYDRNAQRRRRTARFARLSQEQIGIVLHVLNPSR
jgi:hypothetical protein